MRTPTLRIYSGPNCCLCDKAKELIAKVAEDTPLILEEVDIHSDSALYERFRYAIPVIALDGQLIMAGKVTELWLRRAIRGEPLGRDTLSALDYRP